MQIILDAKIFVAPAPKGRMVRKAYELIETLSLTEPKVSDLDALVNFAVDLFGKQFTVDDVYDGIDATDLLSTLVGIVQMVMGKVKGKLDQFPNAEAGR